MQKFGTIILVVAIYYLGNICSDLISPFIVIPGNLIGMGILYVLLSTKIVKLSFIEKTGSFFLKHMSLFFVPFGVSIIASYDLIKEDILSLILTIFLSTLVSMWLTAKVIDIFQKRRSQ